MDSLTLLNTTSLLGYEETTDTDSDFTGFKDSQLFDSNMSFIRKFYHGRNYSQRVIIDIGIELRITFHALIFILAVTGNTLVISVLAQNKRMRTVTNVFLLNLAISDLLLAVFCIPFTLIPVILKNFIFGAVMCVLVRYLQATLVAVNSLTLLALSLERYFAICHPLRSRRWQTLSHSYKIILGVWVSALLFIVPVAVFQQLKTMRNGNKLCIEIWPNKNLEKVYQILLDIVLFLLPLLMMMVAYSLIARNLYAGIDCDFKLPQSQGSKGRCKRSSNEMSTKQNKETSSTTAFGGESEQNNKNNFPSENRSVPFFRRTIKSSTMENIPFQQVQQERSLQNKKRVVKMLFVVVLEFFICWTPLFTVITWEILDIPSSRRNLTSMTKSYIQLLAYTSTCCNPITYCFMNSRFRQGFISAFRCRRHSHVQSYKGKTNSTIIA